MAESPVRSRWREQALILGHFMRRPATVGTVTPSSRYLAAAMVESIEPGSTATVVELGPGTGAFTGAILRRLGPAGRFLAVELEPEFVRQLQDRFPGVGVVCASAVDLVQIAGARGLAPIDHIVSGLPFATLAVETTRAILDAVPRVLRPGGTFTTFQYVHGFAMPRSVAFRRDLSERMQSPPERTFVARNFPPAFALRWRRPAD
jgi:phosphatidylethanolamine/phosphatidyl-N-methylethanolamine N-methyltransferase